MANTHSVHHVNAQMDGSADHMRHEAPPATDLHADSTPSTCHNGDHEARRPIQPPAVEPAEANGNASRVEADAKPADAVHSSQHRGVAAEVAEKSADLRADLQADVQPAASAATETHAADAPNGELRSDEAWRRATAAVAALRGQGRQRNGRAGVGNTLRLSHGLRSARLIQQPDIAAWHREQVEVIAADLGGDEELTALQRGLVRETARVEVILASLGEQLLQGGVLTPKGKLRAASSLYLSVLDRFARLSAQLGLQRRQRAVSLHDYLEARRVNAPDGGGDR